MRAPKINFFSKINRKKTLGLAGTLILGLWLPSSANAVDFSQKGKNWKAKIKSQYVYDSNVTQNPIEGRDVPLSLRGADNDDSAINYDAFASYTVNFTKKFKVEGSYEIDGTTYFELSRYDLITQMFGLKPVYNISPLANITFQYFYFHNINDGNSFSGVNYISPSFNHFSKKFGVTRLYLKYKSTDNFVNQGRDADSYGVGFKHIYLFSNYQNNVGIGYEYSNDDTAGNFDRDIHTVTVSSKVSLPLDVVMNTSYRYSNRDYRTFLATTAPNTREDFFHTFRANFQKVFLKNFGIIEKVLGNVKYTYNFNDSNTEFREYQNHRVDVGLDVRF
ncbi:MAG: DUF560 domain-containing protein [Candidatus Nitronauta litoralis]|uniref:DUF560 domain-containing protein n=1 Tax=Candidatus Nitronauta litoralis TaxID=2705533 RepID=A0A7T0G0W7_9BACT|nr:MAG: DUF560 domain-containing protein [Candidatus Nitronauta litoralis]